MSRKETKEPIENLISTGVKSIESDSHISAPFTKASAYNRLRANFFNSLNRINDQDIMPYGYLAWLMTIFDEVSKVDPERMYNLYFNANLIIDNELFDNLKVNRSSLSEIIKDRFLEMLVPILMSAPDFYEEEENKWMNSPQHKIEFLVKLMTAPKTSGFSLKREVEEIEAAKNRQNEIDTDNYTLRFF
jgi:hypothetical protein